MTKAASTRSRCLLHQPVGAVEFAAFLIGGEGQNQIALRLVAFAMQAQESGDQRGVGVLHVLRAAAVVVAVLLDELEGIGVPVGAQSLHHVNVAEEEHRLFRGRACGADADHEVLLVRVGAEQVHIVGRESGVEKALLHGVGCGGHVALGRVGGVDLDELLEDGAGLGAIGGEVVGKARFAPQSGKLESGRRRQTAARNAGTVTGDACAHCTVGRSACSGNAASAAGLQCGTKSIYR